MSAKDSIHSTQAAVFQPSRRSGAALLGIIALLIVIALGFILLQPAPSQVSEASESPAAAIVRYGNGMEMQYAQPWLTKAGAARPIPYSGALEMQYARPWLTRAEAARPIPYTGALEMQYAQPWLDGNAAGAAEAEAATSHTYDGRYWELAADSAAGLPTADTER